MRDVVVQPGLFPGSLREDKNNGDTYEVLGVSNLDAAPKKMKDHPVEVFHVSQSTGSLWSKSIKRFLAGMPLKGQLKEQYRLI